MTEPRPRTTAALTPEARNALHERTNGYQLGYDAGYASGRSWGRLQGLAVGAAVAGAILAYYWL